MSLSRLSRRSLRLGCWTLLLAIVVLDAGIASSISLGLLYFVPLSVAAFLLPRADALGFAVACTVARVLFGPVGDPLGLGEMTYRLDDALEPIVNAVIACVAYVAVAVVLGRVRSLEREISRLDKQLETDFLTGMGNRRALQRMLEECAISRIDVAVLCCDVDHFKRVNDTFGHDGGDLVLREVASRIAACVRDGDLVARTGGEEFVVVLPGLREPDAAHVAERIREAIRGSPVELPTGRHTITISIGCVAGPAAAELLMEADRAMYAAKEGGRDRVMRAA